METDRNRRVADKIMYGSASEENKDEMFLEMQCIGYMGVVSGEGLQTILLTDYKTKQIFLLSCTQPFSKQQKIFCAKRLLMGWWHLRYKE
jgi:hypothetical protein